MTTDIYLTDREADVMQVLWDHGPSRGQRGEGEAERRARLHHGAHRSCARWSRRVT